MRGERFKEMSWFNKSKRTPREPPHELQATFQSLAAQEDHFGNPTLFQTLNEITSKFTDKRRQLCEDAGFGAFAGGVHNIRIDRNFSLWLMRRVNTLSRSITTSKQTPLYFFYEDAHAIFKLPYKGKKVWDASLPKGADTIDLVRQSVGALSDKEPASLAGERTIRSMHTINTKQDESRFLRAFIIFVVSMMIDSKKPGDREAENYFPALVKMDQVHKYNWAGCVVEAALDACREAKLDEKKRITPWPPAGVILFLHVSTTTIPNHYFLL